MERVHPPFDIARKTSEGIIICPLTASSRFVAYGENGNMPLGTADVGDMVEIHFTGNGLNSLRAICVRCLACKIIGRSDGPHDNQVSEHRGTESFTVKPLFERVVFDQND